MRSPGFLKAVVVSLQVLTNQLVTDLKASWQKTALLGVLLLVGCCFWIPQLMRSLSGKSAKIEVAQAAPAAVAAPARSGSDTTTVSAEPAAKQAFTWKRGERLLQTDPLVRSAEVAAIQTDPFQIDVDQFPPPVLFEQDIQPVRGPETPAEPAIVDSRLVEKLVLKSTILGRNRKAALINDKVYFVGRKIQVDGQVFLVSAIYPRRVLLKQGDDVFELVMPNAFESEAGSEREPQRVP